MEIKNLFVNMSQEQIINILVNNSNVFLKSDVFNILKLVENENIFKLVDLTIEKKNNELLLIIFSNPKILNIIKTNEKYIVNYLKFKKITNYTNLKENDLEVKISDILKDLNMPTNIKEFNYCKRAIYIYSSNRKMKVKEIINQLSFEFSVPYEGIRAGIKRILHIAFVKQTPFPTNSLYEKLAKSNNLRAPKITQFIYLVSDEVNYDL